MKLVVTALQVGLFGAASSVLTNFSCRTLLTVVVEEVHRSFLHGSHSVDLLARFQIFRNEKRMNGDIHCCLLGLEYSAVHGDSAELERMNALPGRSTRTKPRSSYAVTLAGVTIGGGMVIETLDYLYPSSDCAKMRPSLPRHGKEESCLPWTCERSAHHRLCAVKIKQGKDGRSLRIFMSCSRPPRFRPYPRSRRELEL
ncbi:hypothetical protein A0H81_11325 [Grifola frondosa]|uniref:Secreted protein n=1 Tax=Grifola frondosa TaxID=5627 RepID=A0A1C7LVH7_GRIFR|nr:hypothetical protein A0H81_11325 [Grifola frondosa]